MIKKACVFVVGLCVLYALPVSAAFAQNAQEVPRPKPIDRGGETPAQERYIDEKAAETTSPEPVRTEAGEVALPQKDDASESLTVANWGGAYGKAFESAILKPFATENRIIIESISFQGPRGNELSVIEKSDVAPDVVELSALAIGKACDADLIEKIDASTLRPGPNGEAAADDFVAGGLHACGVGTFAWSSLVISTARTKKGRGATSLKQVFSTKAFPGKRAFIKSPRYVFEMALLADGVAPQDIYSVLGSAEGLERVFKKLSELGDSILWLDDAKQAMAQLKSGKAKFAQTFTGRAFFERAKGFEFYPISNGQIYTVNYLAIPKKARARDKARSLLTFATSPERLAAVSALNPYGPMRRSAVDLVKRHALVDIPLDSYLATNSKTLANALAFDEAWWAANGGRMVTAFSEWLAPKPKEPEGPPEAKPKTP